MLGVINILKPTGLTSSDVVVRVRSKLRGALNDKTIKVGHLGTLDPSASGVLPIVFGKATRLFDYCIKSDKVYRACFKFGATTDTLDSEGQVVKKDNFIPELDKIKDSIPRFLGEIKQIPPQYSRISVDGVRACSAIRQGIELEFLPRDITIYSINILDYTDGNLWVDIHCSGGTYIRSLARDLAFSVGALAYMPCLIRLENKGLKIDDAVILDEINKDNVLDYVLSPECLIGELQKVDFGAEDARRILNGLQVVAKGIVGDYKIYIKGKLFGIAVDRENIVEVLIRLWEL